MPCLEVVMPRTDVKTKELLSARFTEVFTASTGFEREIFSIHYSEYSAGEACVAGKMWDGANGVPYLHLHLFCPKLRYSLKRKVVEALTKAFIECVKKPDWTPIIHISEHPYENVGVGGKLLSESEELAKRKFYYELPRD
jgi:4-oxalocrotonate tautomerase